MNGDLDTAALASASDDALLLREVCERATHDVASALAAIRLAGFRPHGVSGCDVDAALLRLEAFVGLQRLLARPTAHRIDLAADIEAMCVFLTTGRPNSCNSRLDLDLRQVWACGIAGRRMLVVAARLVDQSISRALHAREGRVRVVLSSEPAGASFLIEDDGPGPRLLGGGRDDAAAVITELVRRGSGVITQITGPRGTRVTILMPTGLDLDDDLPF